MDDNRVEIYDKRPRTGLGEDFEKRSDGLGIMEKHDPCRPITREEFDELHDIVGKSNI